MGGPTRPADWYPDPFRRAEMRWFNGTDWTADVSIDGIRFLDPLGVAPTAAAGPLPRGLAVAAFVVGCSGVAVAWIPFIFAAGAIDGLVAIALSIGALSAARNGTAGGRTFARWGLVAGIGALPVAVGGFFFTDYVLDELDRISSIGSVEYTVRCDADGRVVSIDGTITNTQSTGTQSTGTQSTGTEDYVIEIEVADGSTVVATDDTLVTDVAAGETRPFELVVFLDETPNRVVCSVTEVRGPSPFDV